MEEDIRTLDRETSRRQRAEAALRESERRFAELVAISEDLICTHDLAGRIATVNPAMARQTGYSRDELVGRLLSDFLSPDTRHEFAKYLEGVERDGHAEGFMRVVTRTGEQRVFQYENVVRETDGGGRIVFGVAHDVQRKWAEQALRISINRLEALLNNIPDAAWMKDDSGRYTAVNEAFARFMNRPREELVGKTDFDLAPRAQAEKSQAEDRSVLSTGESLRISETLVGADGHRVLFETIKTPIRGGAGRPSGTVGIARDISERRRLEEQLVQSQKMEAVGRLAGGVAHDFNNLMTVILGYSDLLLSQLSADHPSRPDLKEIRKAGESAASLTRQLLAFSRKQALAPRVIDLNAVVGGLQSMLGRLIGEDVALVTVLSAEPTLLKADPNQIEQVIVNLVVNARDAMPGGGRLTIETSSVEVDAAYSREHMPMEPGSYVRLSVIDTGTGMDEETKSHIFEPFFTTKEAGRGTGLGLSTVYGVVKQSGGFVWVYTEPGRGTTFHIDLPRCGQPADEQKTEVPVPAVEVKSAGGTILLVEDEEGVRSLARRILENGGYTVLEASSAASAFELAVRHSAPIDLLLTDVVMPDESGPELAQRIEALRPGIRTVYMSGYTEKWLSAQGSLGPGAALLQKPFTAEALLRKAREVLGAPPWA